MLEYIYYVLYDRKCEGYKFSCSILLFHKIVCWTIRAHCNKLSQNSERYKSIIELGLSLLCNKMGLNMFEICTIK